MSEATTPLSPAQYREQPRVPLAPNVARRMLRFELERLCVETGVRHGTIATWLGVSRPAVTAAVAGRSVLSRPALEVLLIRLNRPECFARLDYLISACRRTPRTANTPTHDFPRDAELVVGLEAFANKITVFDPWLVPVHLQTPAYAAALMNHDANAVSAEHQARQAPLADSDTVEFEWITVEHALHRTVGNAEVMRDQRAHLVELANQPNVTIRVVPACTDAATGGGSFQIIWGTPPVVVEHGRLAVLYAHEPEVVAYFAGLLDRLQHQALEPEASVALVTELLNQPGSPAFLGSNNRTA